ncbi:MAG: TonB-dependent receptor [Pacificimonas sp.]|jgi:outer membrane receptor protein involved in Fe transport|nr:TonB-dependent receptor [Pacificimonas sp.]
MTKRLSAASILMLTTALSAPALLGFAAEAQTQSTTTATPAQPSDENLETTIEDVDTVTPGAADEAPDAADDLGEPISPPVEVSGPTGGGDGSVIVIQGRFIPEPVRASSEVLNVLSAEDIARTGEGDIASALQRVTGLSLVGGRFVYVRGLGERYSLALLNGSPLPSPEPLRRVVPLDIFPTSVIASSVVQKSYSVAYPGEFGGGVINLTTPSIPEETFLTVGGSLGGNSQTTFETGYTYFGSDLDFLGFDDGSRDIPVPLQNVIDGVLNPETTVTPAQLTSATLSLNNASTSLIQRNNDIPMNGALDISFGTAIDIGSDRLGIIATAGWDNSWETRGGTEQFVTGVSQDADGNPALIARDGEDFRFLETNNRIVVNGLLGLAYEFGEHNIKWTNLYIRDSLKEARISVGTDGVQVDPDIVVNRSQLNWFERQLIDTQVVAEFEFDEFSFDVRGTYANTQREAPYERSFTYAFDDRITANFDPTTVPELVAQGITEPVVIDGVFVNDLTSPGQDARLAFSDLSEDIYAGATDVSYILPTDREIILSAGAAYTETQRESERFGFRYVRGANTEPFPDTIRQLRPDFLLSDFVVSTFGVTLQPTFAASQEVVRYEASLETVGAYAQVEAEVADFVRATVGVRYEDSTQQVDAFDLNGLLIQTSIEEDYFLPAGTLTWNFADDMQLRFAASKTIARPQFRELAPQQFLDNESNRVFIGNQFLEDSELLNFEGRYEWYPARNDRVSFAAFYKEIDNPIEAVATVQGQTFFTTFSNAPEATLFGIEAEVQKYFPLYDWGFEDGLLSSRNFVVVANYTYTDSEVTVGADDQVISNETGQPIPATTFFIDGEPLVGQSDHLANLQIGFEDEDTLSQQTILLSYASERVTSRFTGGLPGGERVAIPFVEDPGIDLDIVIRQGLELGGVNFEAKLEARNLLGEDYEEFQELGDSRIDRNVFERGQSYSFGLAVTF